MLYKKYSYLFILFFWTFSICILDAQTRKVIKENKIKSITVYEEKYEKEKDKNEVIESVVIYDEKGNITEEKEYNSEGKLKNHFKYKYDDLSRKIKETEFDENGNAIEIIEYKYQGDLKTERIKYDGKGNIVSRKRYEYSNFH